MDTKFCKSCGETKPIKEFTKSRSKLNWKESNNFKHNQRQKYHSYCKECNARKGKEFRAKYREKHGRGYTGTNKLKKVPIEERKLISLIRSRLTEAKGRAKKFDQIEPNIDEDYLYELLKNQDNKCALTGCKFVIEKKHPLCPSLDKIDPKKGYVKGNVQWLGWAVNRAKGDLSMLDFVMMCRRVTERATTIPKGSRDKCLEAQNSS